MRSSEARGPHTGVIAAVILGWIWLYNVVIKGQGAGEALLRLLDTLSEDVVMGSVITVGVGSAIVVVFTATKLYTQVISEAHSFRLLEQIAQDAWRTGDGRALAGRLLALEDETPPPQAHPDTIAGVLGAFAFLYVMSWVYLVLFSEALFFVSWSAGVDLPITRENVNLLPTLALAIPFSARVMAYLRYRYTQDYADFMPGALFVLLMVASLGQVFGSDDQKFFLLQVYNDPVYLAGFLQNGLMIAFIPVFTEGVYWVVGAMLQGDAPIPGGDAPDVPPDDGTPLP